MVVAGAILVALLAIIAEVALGGVERAVRPRTRSRASAGAEEPEPAEPVMIGQR
jgi:HAMP domain-containing protein